MTDLLDRLKRRSPQFLQAAIVSRPETSLPAIDQTISSGEQALLSEACWMHKLGLNIQCIAAVSVLMRGSTVSHCKRKYGDSLYDQQHEALGPVGISDAKAVHDVLTVQSGV